MATKRHRHGRLAASLAFTGALAGVLIWSKLRLSTDMPRSAYADPKDRALESPPQAGDPGAPVEAPEPGAGEARNTGEPVESEAVPGEG
ncbi:MAG: hypothetical protein ACF8Q5_04525 [Phycisphaerales bacterium JB040]